MSHWWQTEQKNSAILINFFSFDCQKSMQSWNSKLYSKAILEDIKYQQIFHPGLPEIPSPNGSQEVMSSGREGNKSKKTPLQNWYTWYIVPYSQCQPLKSRVPILEAIWKVFLVIVCGGYLPLKTSSTDMIEEQLHSFRWSDLICDRWCPMGQWRNFCTKFDTNSKKQSPYNLIK